MSNRHMVRALCALCVAQWAILLAPWSLLEHVPRWFWQRTPHVLAAWWILPVLALAAAWSVRDVLRHPRRHAGNVVLLIALGTVLQQGLAWSEGRGFAGMRDRLVTTGHAEFARLAVTDLTARDVATRYEELVRTRRVGEYAPAKPPGQLLFFMAVERVARALPPAPRPGERLARLVTFASLLFPLLTYLALVPLHAFSRRLLPEPWVSVPCILYVLVPNVDLVTLHMDQVLYPFLFMAGLYAYVRACDRGHVALAFASGVFACGALYVSFSLVPLLPLCGLYAIAHALLPLSAREAADPRGADRALLRARLDASALTLAAFWVGLVATALAMRWALGYDALLRYQNALDYHHHWKGWRPEPGFVAYFAGLNTFELAWWVGAPVSVLFADDLLDVLRRARRRGVTIADFATAGGTIVLGLLALLGKTKGETARLWLFLVPLLCVGACRALSRRFPGHPGRTTAGIVALQSVTLVAIKAAMDFH